MQTDQNSNRVKNIQEEELTHAKKLLAKGVLPDQVLEVLSKRLSQKLLHPILTAIKNNNNNYNAEESKKRYEENYLNKRNKSAEHVKKDQ
jgi:glutamyl-tRNA reductase